MSYNIYTQVSKGEFGYSFSHKLEMKQPPRNVLVCWDLSKLGSRVHMLPSGWRHDKWSPEIRKLAGMGHEAWYNYIFPPSLNFGTRCAQRKVTLLCEKKGALSKMKTQHVSRQHSCPDGSKFGVRWNGALEDHRMCSEKQRHKKDLRREGQKIRAR